jgi:selT/selW/selH-like putative selenoprotein
MTETLLKEFETSVESWEFIPGESGAYEVKVNGDLVFSKKSIGRHAEIDEIREALANKLR